MLSLPKRSIILLHGFFDRKFFASFSNSDAIYILEGRPNLKSSKQLVKELNRCGITPTVISDNMAGFLFGQDLIKEVWIAYQEESNEGILALTGSLILAVLCKKHELPFHISPTAQRIKFNGTAKDLLDFNGQKINSGIRCYVPLVEWIPYGYIKDYESSAH